MLIPWHVRVRGQSPQILILVLKLFLSSIRPLTTLMSDTFNNTSAIQGGEEEEVVVGWILLGHSLDDLLGQYSSYDGTHRAQLAKNNPVEMW